MQPLWIGPCLNGSLLRALQSHDKCAIYTLRGLNIPPETLEAALVHHCVPIQGKCRQSAYPLLEDGYAFHAGGSGRSPPARTEAISQLRLGFQQASQELPAARRKVQAEPQGLRCFLRPI